MQPYSYIAAAVMLQLLPLTTFLPAAARLVAIGDLHGDMNKTRRAFKVAGLIDNQDRWTGGTTTAVQVCFAAWKAVTSDCSMILLL